MFEILKRKHQNYLLKPIFSTFALLRSKMVTLTKFPPISLAKPVPGVAMQYAIKTQGAM